MKHLGYIIALLVVMLVPAACTDSNNYVYNDVNAPAMLSFGFYKADNPGVLGSDYVVELTADQTGGAATQTVSVALPPTVEKNNLVARFTTSEGTTVKVGGAEQVSQTTANDFSQPIDYILTRGSVSRRCEVTVTKASLRWVETAQVAGITTYGNPVLKINPVDQKPYIGFKTRAGNSATAANHSTVLTLGDDGEWTAVGSEGFGHTVNSSYFDFDIAPDGTLYVAYADQQATVLKNGMSVMKYNGSDWEFVGTDKGLLKAVSNYVGFCALDGELVGAWSTTLPRPTIPTVPSSCPTTRTAPGTVRCPAPSPIRCIWPMWLAARTLLMSSASTAALSMASTMATTCCDTRAASGHR